MKNTFFWDVTPCSPLRANRLLGRYRLHLQGWKNKLFSLWFLAQLILSTLKMEAISSSETSVDPHRTTRCYIPEDGTLRTNMLFLPFPVETAWYFRYATFERIFNIFFNVICRKMLRSNICYVYYAVRKEASVPILIDTQLLRKHYFSEENGTFTYTNIIMGWCKNYSSYSQKYDGYDAWLKEKFCAFSLIFNLIVRLYTQHAGI
jgi:hypothetical protein